MQNGAGMDVERIADEIFDRTGFDPEEPPSIGRLCLMLTGHPPTVVPSREMQNDGSCSLVDQHWRVFVRDGLPPERAVFVAAHECAEWWFLHAGYQGADLEARCDALGAALVAPRAAFQRALGVVGHSVHALAEAFHAPQQLALLRIGEVTGRPVVLVRPKPIARGAAFSWPTGRALTRAVLSPPPSAHPVRVGQEWALMARRGAWADAA